jgi:hypothetical protein
MPAYKVTGTSSVVVMGARYNPNDIFTSESELADLPAGVTKTADAPAYDPILQNEVKAGGASDSGNIAIVDYKGCKLKLKAVTGSVGIKFNVTDNVEVILHADAELIIDCYTRIVWKVIYAFKEATSKLSVKVLRM